MSIEYDTLVVGSGFAGLSAAAALCAAGQRVALVATGSGSLVFAGACLSLPGGPDPALRAFTEFAATAGCRYTGSEQFESLLPTLLGELQPVAFAPHFLDRLVPENPLDDGLCAVVGIEELSGFDAGFLADRLNQSAAEKGLLRRHVSHTVRLGCSLGVPLTLLAVARRFDADRVFRAELAAQLREAAADADSLLLPAMLGLDSTERTLDAFERAVGLPVRELVTLPPSVAGLRVERLLKKRLRSLGVEFFEGFPVRTLRIQQHVCTAVEVEAPARPLQLRAAAVLLAGGRHQGRLLGLEPLRLDDRQRPLDASGNLYAENVVCAPSPAVPLHAANLGRIRAGFNAAQSVLVGEVYFAHR